jgi:hypothetical protein
MPVAARTDASAPDRALSGWLAKANSTAATPMRVFADLKATDAAIGVNTFTAVASGWSERGACARNVACVRAAIYGVPRPAHPPSFTKAAHPVASRGPDTATSMSGGRWTRHPNDSRLSVSDSKEHTHPVPHRAFQGENRSPSINLPHRPVQDAQQPFRPSGMMALSFKSTTPQPPACGVPGHHQKAACPINQL